MPSQPLGHDAEPSAGALRTARTHCPFSTSPSCCFCPSTLLTLPTIVMRFYFLLRVVQSVSRVAAKLGEQTQPPLSGAGRTGAA